MKVTRRVAARPLLFLALLVAPSAAQNPPGTQVELGTKGAVSLEEGEFTEVRGKIDADLVGTWLSAEVHVLPGKDAGQRFYPTLQLYRISKTQEGGLWVNWIPFAPPAEVEKELKKAQAEQKSWTPSAAQVKAITAALVATPVVADQDERGRHYVSQPDQLDGPSRKAPASKNAKFAIQSLLQLYRRPMFGQSYYVKTVAKNEFSGDMTMGAVTQNVKGVPLPVGTTGTFRWIRLDLPPPPTVARPGSAATPAAPPTAARDAATPAGATPAGPQK